MEMTLFLPELALIGMVLVLFFMTLKPVRQSTLQGLALVLAAVVVVAAMYGMTRSGTLFYDAYRVDALSQLFKVMITFGLFLLIYLGIGLKGIETELQPEYLLFLTVSAAGLVLMSSSVELLTLLISLEISSFALYVIIPFRNQRKFRSQMEAGIKYVLFGAATTGIMLYGMSYLFGVAHTTYIDALMVKIPPLLKAGSMVTIIGLIMLLAGLFFKLALFPMHFWAPDVYEGAANETSAFVATLPKIAAVALLIRLVSLAGTEIAEVSWVLGVFAVISMTFGNLAALVQTDLKRLLAFSSIAHAGYIMVGILCLNTLGMVSATYYIGGYLLMNLAVFFVIYQLGEGGNNVSLDDLRGLYKRAPLMAFTLLVGAFAMAGIPPTVGFTGKVIIFTAAIKEGLYALVIISVINTGVSAFYYLKMVRAAYTLADDETQGRAPGVMARLVSAPSLMGLFFITAIIALGIYPQPFLDVAQHAALAGMLK
ncbi:MAG: NADH-quinone oxidoreductase subunit N [Deltaproteobacteria bacterium]|nr:MAG: NADH-quinone oxidoreductase subunit N [Deltaproteobacteria bacterium]